MKPLTDIALNSDLDMIIREGDVLFGEETETSIHLILRSRPGDFVLNVFAGAGLESFLNSRFTSTERVRLEKVVLEQLRINEIDAQPKVNQNGTITIE